MGIYFFWSTVDATVSGLTSDPEGANLPADLAPWIRNGEGQALYTGPAGTDTATNRVLQAVQRDGFYLMRTGPAAPPSGRQLH